MQLRSYQKDAIKETYKYMKQNPSKNPCIVLPTGAGKTPVIAQICRDMAAAGGRVLILSHVKELVAQTAKTLAWFAPDVDVGIHSAGLKKRDHDNQVIVGGVQSVARRMDQLGEFRLLLVDEAHRIPTSGTGQYQRVYAALKEANRSIRVIGLTATPYRTDAGVIYGEDDLFSDISYDVPVSELVCAGFLAPVIAKQGDGHVTMDGIRKQCGDYDQDAVATKLLDEKVLAASVREVVELSKGRKSCLIFCSNVHHAEEVRDAIRGHGEKCETVHSKMPRGERDSVLANFRENKLKFLTNCSILTTGFDHPETDVVVLMRATMSPGLYYQMVGRGFRISEGKQDCLLLDYCTNVERHGPVDFINPKKKKAERVVICDECDLVWSVSKTVCTCGELLKPQTCQGCEAEFRRREKKCPECGMMVQEAKKDCPECGEQIAYGAIACYVCGADLLAKKHGGKAGKLSPIAGSYDLDVYSIAYHFNKGKNGKKDTLRVEYYYGDPHAGCSICEWVCIEHGDTSYAGQMAARWWGARSTIDMPPAVSLAKDIGSVGFLAEPDSIRVIYKKDNDFPNIIPLFKNHEPKKPDLNNVKADIYSCEDATAMKAYILEVSDVPDSVWGPTPEEDEIELPF